ncbi:MAG: hypothetical protein J0I06_14480 [Planctomycetes bacterium]|nr:hypothetical protein [Planctomycetota bacterium]
MRIEPTGTAPIASKPVESAPRAAAKSADGATGAAGDAESFSLSGDLTALLAAVRQTPDVRTQVIESAATNLAAGVFDTPEAAAGAARALLDSGDAAPPQ